MSTSDLSLQVAVAKQGTESLSTLQELQVAVETSETMSNRYANLNEVIALLDSGEWELGYGEGTRSNGHFWLQRGGLTRGGETREVRSSTFEALLRRKLVEIVPRTSKQPFWLRRYRYTGKEVIR